MNDELRLFTRQDVVLSDIGKPGHADQDRDVRDFEASNDVDANRESLYNQLNRVTRDKGCSRFHEVQKSQ